MRLKQIKLAGFKSFVDPTVIGFPGNRCAVVGPNGCGKSNIVDAVRWVLGESSARQLRAEALTDVIFNGAAGRKLAGLAVVELLFDNSAGRIGGEYASYGEIAVRREVSRDHRSTYFLNGAQCRRRDIADLFFGTGMGPRSYAVIEQGMISSLVESRPEELRVHLEEAAGISKYKERRRETENRIRHTEENLARLQDIRDELAQQLERLQRQAKAAERHQVLKAEEQRVNAELQAMQSRRLAGELETLDAALVRQQTKLEKSQAELRRIEAEIERCRASRTEAGDALNEAQGRYYQLSADIARDEEAMQRHRGRLQELRAEQDAVAERTQETARQLDSDQAKIEEMQLQAARLKPTLEAAEADEAAAAQRLSELEESYKTWEADWDEFSRQAAGRERDAGIQASRLSHQKTAIEQLQERLRGLGEESAPAQFDRSEVDGLVEEIDKLGRQRGELGDELAASQERLRTAQEDLAAKEVELDEGRTEVQRQRQEMARLQAAQQLALGRSDVNAQAWLEGQGLGGTERLGETLSVAPGWEHSVEMVLGDFVQAVKVDDLEGYADRVEALADGHLALVEGRLDAETSGELPSLASLVSGAGLKLGSLLHGVFAAESDAAAWAVRPSLKLGESVVTRNGLWLGRDWLRRLSKVQAGAGVVERSQELAALEGRVQKSERRLEERRQAVAQGRQAVQAAEGEREELRRRSFELEGRIGELKADHGVRQTKLDEAQARQGRRRKEREGLQQQLRKEQAMQAEVQAALQVLEEAGAGEQARRQELAAARERLHDGLEQARRQAREQHESLHVLRAQQQGLASSLEAVATVRQRLVAQASELAQSRRRIEESQAANEAPLPGLRRNLDDNLERKVAIEKELNELRRRSGELDDLIRKLEAARGEAQEGVEQARSAAEGLRVDREGLRVQKDHLIEQIEASGHQVEALLQELPEDASDAGWADKLASLDRRLQRLGPINLAAVDELQAQSERKAYLDAQHEDLTNALETLTQAIHRIDRETRARFKDTFDQVNAQLGELFPKVFGGGRAHLEMTGNDLLSTGVALFAQPPGKRNTSVNLLSGGEKALTAIALIFAIFQLNPSPVCLLDEVDAPLDDTNVARFVGLLEEMSQEVQFVVVTHNKLTMEMADHLLGVTMNEPGVSRLVSVDVEKAAALAAAG